MVRQDPRYRGTEEGNDAKRTYSNKVGTAKMSWSCYKNAWHATTKESFLWRISGRKTLSRRLKKRYKETLKDSLKDFNIPTNSLEQAAQDRTNRRCLNKKGTAQKRNRKSVTKNRQQNPEKNYCLETVSKNCCCVCGWGRAGRADNSFSSRASSSIYEAVKTFS